MKTCAIINVWDGEELLYAAVRNWLKCVDKVLIVYSLKSNSGEDNPSLMKTLKEIDEIFPWRVIMYEHEPNLSMSVVDNERAKRNNGLLYAIINRFTHFVTADVDEFYDPDQFKEELKRFEDPELKGLVCASQVYFKYPWLTIGLDTTLVPFIHKITPDLSYEMNRHYPFAWDNRSIRIDPTRQFNINSGVQWSDIIMHHYSYVRKDLEKKIRNSTARANLERSTVLQDYLQAKEGYFCQFYGKTLIRASVDFGIPDVQNIQPLETKGGQEARNS